MLLIAVAVILLFSFVVFVGAPYLPTRRAQYEAALDMLDLPEGAHLYDLGSGDGRMLRAAAKRGLRATGYELNPLLVLVSLAVTWRYRRHINIRWANFWIADIADADGIYIFLLDKFMPQLAGKLSKDCRGGVLVASFAFKFPGKKILRTSRGIYLYRF